MNDKKESIINEYLLGDYSSPSVRRIKRSVSTEFPIKKSLQPRLQIFGNQH